MDPRPILRSNCLYLSDETCFPLCWLGGRLLISCTSRALYFLRFGLTNSFKEEDIFGVPGFVMSCSLVLGNPGTKCSLVKELHGEDRPLTKPLHDDGRGPGSSLKCAHTFACSDLKLAIGNMMGKLDPTILPATRNLTCNQAAWIQMHFHSKLMLN